MTASDEPAASTFADEGSLPRVPLPSVAQSCARLLEWCAPLLTAQELAETEAAVAAFQRPGGPAGRLQTALECYDASDGVGSWLDRFWRDRYLGRRDRIALNANFFFLFAGTGQDQVERAAALVAAAASYKLTLDAERIPPAVQRGRPLSMEQQRYLFSATRIPGVERDTVRTPYTDAWPGPSAARHVVVLLRGDMFRLDVIGEDGRPRSRVEVAGGLRALMAARADAAAPGESVGHLTTKARAEWAHSRQALLDHDPRNADQLDTVETALFCLCLDDVAPTDTRGVCERLLCGEDGNRWYDKALSLIVLADGTAGINVEHCRLDGTTVLGFVDEVLADADGAEADPDSDADDADRRAEDGDDGAGTRAPPAFAPLRFVLDDALRADVRAAAEAFSVYAQGIATTVLTFDDFGSDRGKRLGVSPDAFVQLAYQLAHERVRGFVGATYESIATRGFRHGRTEAMRVITPEIQSFVTAVDDPSVDDDARRAALRAAAEKHVERAKDCQAGRAPEQHLWELEMIQGREGEELGAAEPIALYDSPGWLRMRDDYLNTSSAPSASIEQFGFGPTGEHCIGVAYVLRPDRWYVHLSAPGPIRNEMLAFADRLREAVDELQVLLEPAGDRRRR